MRAATSVCDSPAACRSAVRSVTRRRRSWAMRRSAISRKPGSSGSRSPGSGSSASRPATGSSTLIPLRISHIRDLRQLREQATEIRGRPRRVKAYFRNQTVIPVKIPHLRGSASVPRWVTPPCGRFGLPSKVRKIMPGRLTAAAHGRRRAGSTLLVGASAATLVLAQAATAVAAPTVTSTASQAQQPLSAAQAAKLSQNVTQHVIVFRKDEPPAARAGSAAARIRSNAVAASQSPVLSELRQVHATHVRPYRLVNAFAATVSAGEEARLKANTSVQRVIPDAMIQGPAAPAAPTGPASPAALATLPGACTSAVNGELEPEALSLTHTDSDTGTNTARSLGFDGSGVQVAFLADGLDPNNVNFIRPDAKSVFDSSIGGDYTDFSGDGVGAVTGGAEAFLDANALAWQGTHDSTHSPTMSNPPRSRRLPG